MDMRLGDDYISISQTSGGTTSIYLASKTQVNLFTVSLPYNNNRSTLFSITDICKLQFRFDYKVILISTW